MNTKFIEYNITIPQLQNMKEFYLRNISNYVENNTSKEQQFSEVEN